MLALERRAISKVRGRSDQHDSSPGRSGNVDHSIQVIAIVKQYLLVAPGRRDGRHPAPTPSSNRVLNFFAGQLSVQFTLGSGRKCFRLTWAEKTFDGGRRFECG